MILLLLIAALITVAAVAVPRSLAPVSATQSGYNQESAVREIVYPLGQSNAEPLFNLVASLLFSPSLASHRNRRIQRRRAPRVAQ